MGNFAVVDTETNWVDQVMSIGVVIADMDTFRPIDAKYHVYTPEYEIGDVIGIGDTEFSYFCFPKTKTSVTKARLATEELYKMKKKRRA